MKQRFAIRAFLKRLFTKLQELSQRRTDVRYTSVPLWRPWRDF